VNVWIFRLKNILSFPLSLSLSLGALCAFEWREICGGENSRKVYEIIFNFFAKENELLDCFGGDNSGRIP
jgi:hypothetical protein